MLPANDCPHPSVFHHVGGRRRSQITAGMTAVNAHTRVDCMLVELEVRYRRGC